MRTIFILMDSLNRRFLPCYGNDWVQAPNIGRLSRRGLTFDNHYCASMPCMPARRDLFNGRYNFLETPWGPVEPYDERLPSLLRGIDGAGNPGRRKHTYCHLITDHYHYWEWNGHGYHCFFDTWEFLRGQEGDPEVPRVLDPPMPEKVRGKGADRRQDWVNRSVMDPENDLDYPTPRSFRRAIDFVEHNHLADDWFLHLEVFDPHEPFMCPRKYRDLYNDTWDGGYHYDWPKYGPLEAGDDPAAVEHIRKCYAGTLTMADAWLGKLLDAMDRHDMWEDTNVILTTDHGHLLGEHGYWAKNYPFDYQELVNIPLLVAGPGVPQGRRRTGLTSAIDLAPTILDLHGREPLRHAHGRSLTPLLTQDAPHHDAVLYGYFGKDLNWTDGRHTYCRQPLKGSAVHHHTAMAVNALGKNPGAFATAECGHFLKQSAIPVYRASVKSHHHRDAPDYNPIYDLREDPCQLRPIQDAAMEADLAAKLKAKLDEVDAPACQYARTGLVG